MLHSLRNLFNSDFNVCNLYDFIYFILFLHLWIFEFNKFNSNRGLISYILISISSEFMLNQMLEIKNWIFNLINWKSARIWSMQKRDGNKRANMRSIRSFSKVSHNPLIFTMVLTFTSNPSIVTWTNSQKVASVLYTQVLSCDFDLVPFYIFDMKGGSDNIRMFGSSFPSKHSHNYNRRLLPSYYLLFVSFIPNSSDKPKSFWLIQ